MFFFHLWLVGRSGKPLSKNSGGGLPGSAFWASSFGPLGLASPPQCGFCSDATEQQFTIRYALYFCPAQTFAATRTVVRMQLRFKQSISNNITVIVVSGRTKWPHSDIKSFMVN